VTGDEMNTPLSLRKDRADRARKFVDGVAARFDARHYRATSETKNVSVVFLVCFVCLV